MSNYVQTVGYGGSAPIAIIFWYKDDVAVCKTICYTEQDVESMYARYLAAGDMYNDLKPSIHVIVPWIIKTSLLAC